MFALTLYYSSYCSVDDLFIAAYLIKLRVRHHRYYSLIMNMQPIFLFCLSLSDRDLANYAEDAMSESTDIFLANWSCNFTARL